ncbi:hypothetical protein LOC67_13305 [Stieleria sp. JC731]|uniref:hypothetical protein n=1 Tax=Pirellulaceae TaxID=2691357 RepID=UPI001E62DE24|nr:hypothetical protein [Stieleria sp. JC731]MCC9601528.1 hypothetical protein [Stieleria sp. JC731]
MARSDLEVFVPTLFSIRHVSADDAGEVSLASARRVVASDQSDPIWRLDPPEQTCEAISRAPVSNVRAMAGQAKKFAAVNDSTGQVAECDQLNPHCADLIVALGQWSMRLDQRESELDTREKELNRRTRFLRQST